MHPPKHSPALLAALTCLVLAGLLSWAGPAAAAKRLGVESVRVGTKAGPLKIEVRAGLFANVRIWANGHRVRQHFQFSGRHTQAIELRAVDGLRAGVNRLRIRSESGGRVATARRTVRLSPRVLLADAGANTGAIVHRRARVGTAPAPAGTGAADRYRWGIESRPPGSRARLSDRNGPRPVLHARTPGTYVLQLVANPGGPVGPSYDQVTVTVVPPDPPIGVPIQTLGANGAITVGDFTFATAGNIRYLVLDRETRQPAVEGDGAQRRIVAGSVANNAAGVDKLRAVAGRYGSNGGGNVMDYLMVVNGREGIGWDARDTFAGLVKDLGAERLGVENFDALGRQGEFSIIGIPGAPAGAATLRIPGIYNPRVSANIEGYLQRGLANNPGGEPLYEYVAPEHPRFDTRVPGSTDSANTMAVDGRRFSATLPSGATAGLHVLVLESLTLKPLEELVLRTNGGSDRALQQEAGEALGKAIVKPGGALVLVQTIGKPKAAGPEWGGIVEALGRLGANRNYVNALDGTTEYALVARLGSDAPPAEASTAYDHTYPAPNRPPARLVGVLARSRTSAFEPNVTGTPTAKEPEGGVNIGMIEVAYQKSQPWPDLGLKAKPGEEAAAQNYLCQQLGFCQAVSSCPTLRDCYWQRFEANWTLKAGQIANTSFPRGQSDFSEATFGAVKAQLYKEVTAVANIQFFLAELQQPFDLSAGGSHVKLDKLADDIWNTLPRPEYDNRLSWVLGLIGKIVNVGVFAGPPINVGAAGTAASFGLASYLSNKQGRPLLSSQVKTRASQLGVELIDRINLTRRTTLGLGMLLVSDYGKLTAANQHINSDWGPISPELMVEPLETASKQWFYEELIPAAFPYLIRGNATNARFLDCKLSRGAAWPNQPDAFQMTAPVSYYENGAPNNATFFFARGIGGASSPSSAIGDEMFRPQRGVAKPGLGIEKLAFFTPRVFGGKISHAVNGVPFCQLGFLPSQW